MKDLFKNIKKGTVTEEKGYIVWNLNNMVLRIFEDPYEYYVGCDIYRKIFRKEKLCNVTHLHLEKDEMETFVKEVDNPDKRIRIKKWGRFFALDCSLDIVDKDDNESGCYYSEI